MALWKRNEYSIIIKANSEEEALDMACEWFSERKPNTKIEMTDEEADNE